MHGLKELQAAFKRGVMQGDAGIIDVIADSQTASRELRLAVYEHAYRSRLVEALGTDCAMLQKLLGEAPFTALAQGYIDAHPSRFFSLRWFSGELARYLGYDAKQGGHGWEADMAQLELSFVDTFDAADGPVAGEAEAAAIAPEAWAGLRLDFHPSVQLISLHWNTLERWRAAKQDETVPAPRRLEQALKCLLWRQQLSTQYRSLQPLEAIALQAAMAGAGFAEICGVMADCLQDQQQVPMLVAAYLKSWLAAGLISALQP